MMVFFSLTYFNWNNKLFISSCYSYVLYALDALDVMILTSVIENEEKKLHNGSQLYASFLIFYPSYSSEFNFDFFISQTKRV